MARSEDSFVNARIQSKPTIWESGKWYQKLNKPVNDTGSHYTAEQVSRFESAGIERIAGVHKCCA